MPLPKTNQRSCPGHEGLTCLYFSSLQKICIMTQWSETLCCSSGAIEVQSSDIQQQLHLKASCGSHGIVIGDKKEIVPSNASSGISTGQMMFQKQLQSELREKERGQNWACLSSSELKTDSYLTHPSMGDCVIHLGVIPAPEQQVISR